MPTFYLKDVIDKFRTNPSAIIIDIDLSKLSEVAGSITIDCENDDTPMKLVFTARYGDELTITNCTQKQISFSKNSHEGAAMRFHGTQNDICCCRGNIVIYGGENNIDVMGDKASATVHDDNNKIYSYINSLTAVRGNNNKVMAFANAEVEVATKTENNQIYLFDHASLRNTSPTSQIIAKNESSIRSVVEPVFLLDQASFCKIYTGYAGKQVCKEPLADGKRGYFYKAVRTDMLPFYNSENAPKYVVDEYYYPDSFDNSSYQCSHGIHFFPDIPHVINYMSSESSYIVLRLIVEFDDFAPLDEFSNENKYRASKVFVDSIVPEEEYTDIQKKNTFELPNFSGFVCATCPI